MATGSALTSEVVQSTAMPETIEVLVRESVAGVTDPEAAEVIGGWTRSALVRERDLAVRDFARASARQKRHRERVAADR